MKTFYTLFLTIFSLSLSAQLAPDFDVTDTHGVTHSLYEDYLDQGKTVVLDLFFVNCPPCNELSPLLEPVYQAWGAGTANVQFISLTADQGDSDQKVLDFEALHGNTWPAVSNDGGGPPANIPYQQGTFGQFFGYPSLVIISPDGSVQFETVGIVPDTPALLDEWIEDTGAVKPPVVDVNDIDNVVSFSLTPNPVNDRGTLTFDLNAPSETNIQIFNQLGQQVLDLYSASLSAGEQTINFNTTSLQSGTYFIRVAMKNQITMQQFVKI